jgi:phage portal protein BeeE
MAKKKGRVGRLLESIGNPFRRRRTPEPQMPLWTTGIQEPTLVQGITIPALYAVANENLILRTVITTLQQEIFRRGYYWEKKFHKKCANCEEEFQHDAEECTECGAHDMLTPDVNQLIYPRWLMEQRNAMEQTFMDVLREIEYDLNITDDAFMILIKEYYIDPETNDMAFYRVKEIIRGDPIFMRIIADKRGVRGGRFRICPIHRDEVRAYSTDEKTCQTCGHDMEDVHHVNTAGSGKTQYYLSGEVLHVSKYQPSKLYGRSPVSTLWRQAMTLTAMDNYMYTAYSKRRIPRGILSVTTDNLESMKSFFKSTDEKLERDPHYIPKIGIESSTGRGGISWIKLMDSLEEMQYIAARDELRQRIAAFYGVSNVFMMDTGKSGGLNNEGMQILVTNRAVEFGHKVYSEHLFPRLMEEMDVVDWKLTLYPNEEEDEVTRLRRDEMEVNIAQRMMMMGFQPKLVEDANRDIRFRFSQPEAPPPGAAPPGQQPGMPPGGGMMPPGGGMMPPGGGGGGMQMGGGMGTPGALPSRNIPPQLAAQMAGQARGASMGQPGGEGMGIRTPSGPASPQNRTSMGDGSPVSSVQQRGAQMGGVQQAANSIINARQYKGA